LQRARQNAIALKAQSEEQEQRARSQLQEQYLMDKHMLRMEQLQKKKLEEQSGRVRMYGDERADFRKVIFLQEFPPRFHSMVHVGQSFAGVKVWNQIMV
jgi:hypothetical protein